MANLYDGQEPDNKEGTKVMKKAKWGAHALLFVLVLMTGLTLTACLDPGIGPEDRFNPVGTWSTINFNEHLTLTLRANGTFTFISAESGSTAVDNGTYIVSGNTIMLTWIDDWGSGPTTQLVVVDNNTLISSGGLVFTRTG